MAVGPSVFDRLHNSPPALTFFRRGGSLAVPHGLVIAYTDFLNRFQRFDLFVFISHAYILAPRKYPGRRLTCTSVALHWNGVVGLHFRFSSTLMCGFVFEREWLGWMGRF
jgi:hypothetical protein